VIAVAMAAGRDLLSRSAGQHHPSPHFSHKGALGI
jgi:hypothetical protein